MMTAKARGKSRIVVFHEDESERPDSPTARGEDVRSIAHLKMLHGVSSKLSRLLEVAEIGATIADELRQLIDYHNCRVFLRDGDDLRPVAFRGDLTKGCRVGARRARDEGRGRRHRPRGGDRRAVPHGRRGQLRHRPPHRRNCPDRGVAAGRAAPVRRQRRRRARDLEARPRPVRRRRRPSARGARRPRVRRARERRPLRGAAPRGGRREGSARAVTGACGLHAARRRGRRRSHVAPSASSVFRGHPCGSRRRDGAGLECRSVWPDG